MVCSNQIFHYSEQLLEKTSNMKWHKEDHKVAIRIARWLMKEGKVDLAPKTSMDNPINISSSESESLSSESNSES